MKKHRLGWRRLQNCSYSSKAMADLSPKDQFFRRQTDLYTVMVGRHVSVFYYSSYVHICKINFVQTWRRVYDQGRNAFYTLILHTAVGR